MNALSPKHERVVAAFRSSPVRSTQMILEVVDELLARSQAVGAVLEAEGCDCDCTAEHADEHDETCERCLGCRVEAALRGEPLSPAEAGSTGAAVERGEGGALKPPAFSARGDGWWCCTVCGALTRTTAEPCSSAWHVRRVAELEEIRAARCSPTEPRPREAALERGEGGA